MNFICVFGENQSKKSVHPEYLTHKSKYYYAYLSYGNEKTKLYSSIVQ